MAGGGGGGGADTGGGGGEVITGGGGGGGAIEGGGGGGGMAAAGISTWVIPDGPSMFPSEVRLPLKSGRSPMMSSGRSGMFRVGTIAGPLSDN